MSEMDQKRKYRCDSTEKNSAGVIEDGELIFDIHQDPYNYVMRTVFCRWKPFILRAMDFDGYTNFARFTKQIPISEKVLSQNLKQLEKDGLVYRTVIPTIPPQVEYRLTERGKSLMPILDAVYEWGWERMREEGLPIDALGEMWHGFREPDEKLMSHPYRKTCHK